MFGIEINPYLSAIIIMAVVCVFAIALFIAPATMVLARSLDWVDDPARSKRKIHKSPVPYLGGVAIYVGFALGLGAFFVFFPELRKTVAFWKWIAPYLTGGLLVLAVGTADDVYDIPAARKLAAQIIIAFLVALGGVRLDHIILPYFGFVEFGIMSIPISMLIIVGAMNAINVIDGIDGLACGVVLVGSVTCFIFSLHFELWRIALLSALLLASIIGLLRHNWYPARIFLGDGGSLLLGYMIAGIVIKCMASARSYEYTFVPMLVFVYPFFDTAVAIFRRILSGKPMMSADRAHIHHRLMNKGYNHDTVTLVICAFSSISIVAALLYAWGLYYLSLAIFVAWCILFVIGIVYSNLFDIRRFRDRVRMRPIIREYNTYGQIAALKMKHAKNENDVWTYLVNTANEYGITEMIWKNKDREINWLKDEFDKGEYLNPLFMRRTGGTVWYFLKEDQNNDISADVELLMRGLVTKMDKRIFELTRERRGLFGKGRVISGLNSPFKEM